MLELLENKRNVHQKQDNYFSNFLFLPNYFLTPPPPLSPCHYPLGLNEMYACVDLFQWALKN